MIDYLMDGAMGMSCQSIAQSVFCPY